MDNQSESISALIARVPFKGGIVYEYTPVGWQFLGLFPVSVLY